MFENATKLTADWLEKNTGYKTDWSPNYTKIKLNEYYVNICNIVHDNFYLHLTDEAIEEYLLNGTYTHVDTLENETVITCKITALADRQYYFLLAQAKQLLYDINNGRASMLSGGKEAICKDTMHDLDRLGLWQRSAFAK
jgi:hypothetical protein